MPYPCRTVFVRLNSLACCRSLTRLLQLYGGLPGRVVEFSSTLPQSQRSRVLKWVGGMFVR